MTDLFDLDVLVLQVFPVTSTSQKRRFDVSENFDSTTGVVSSQFQTEVKENSFFASRLYRPHRMVSHRRIDIAE